MCHSVSAGGVQTYVTDHGWTDCLDVDGGVSHRVDGTAQVCLGTTCDLRRLCDLSRLCDLWRGLDLFEVFRCLLAGCPFFNGIDVCIRTCACVTLFVFVVRHLCVYRLSVCLL